MPLLGLLKSPEGVVILPGWDLYAGSAATREAKFAKTFPEPATSVVIRKALAQIHYSTR
jgi:hypothetical protein